jgi:Fe(3+) dicitrate transport protein
MEDGFLFHRHHTPAAYYFPTVSRMQSFEILKGGSQIQYGPYTTGGAINMVSTQIPRRFSGRVTASIGSFNTKKMSILVTNIKTMVIRIQQSKFRWIQND